MAARAQTPASPVGAPQDSLVIPQLGSANLGYEPVGPGDLLHVFVSGSPELSRSYRVAADGTISLPLLRRPISVAGLLPPAISEAVTRALTRERLLVAPIVSTAVLDYRSRAVSIVGAVKFPTTIQAVGEMTLLDAIARAQGISADAGPEIIVSGTSASAGREPAHIPIKALLSGADPSLNIVLHGGEEIRVPEAARLYVVGNVKTPGTYPLIDVEGSSVLKVLAQSQGVLAYTAKEAYVYRAVTGSSQRLEIAIALKKILRRKAPDFPLQANDILYIPDNSRTRLSAEILEHMAGFGSSTASGLIVWH